MNRVLILLCVVVCCSNVWAQNNSDSGELAANAGEQQKINWLDFETAQEMNKKEPKKFIVDVYTSWCGWCKRMDASTFHHPVIVDYINENYKLELPEGEEYETLGGLIVNQTGEIPEQDSEVTVDNFTFKILEVSNTKIDLVSVRVHTED